MATQFNLTIEFFQLFLTLRIWWKHGTLNKEFLERKWALICQCKTDDFYDVDTDDLLPFRNTLTVFENYSKCRILNFCTVSIELSSNTIRPQNVKVARFARNVKGDFFCDFQPLRFRFSILPPSCCSFLIQFHNGTNYANTALCRLLLEAVSAENRPTLSWTMRWPIYNWILCWTWLPLFLHIDTNRTRIQVQLAF